MSIRHSAWVFGVPRFLKTEYNAVSAQRSPMPGVNPHSGATGRKWPPKQLISERTWISQ
jgi:hypothetical protein